MKLEVNIDKKYFIILASLLVILTGTILVYTYGGTNPSIMGHTGEEIESLTWSKLTEVPGDLCRTNGTGCPVKSTFAGCTAAKYRGYDVKSYESGDSICNASFSGSRMCNSNDFPHAFPTGTCTGWFNTFTPCFSSTVLSTSSSIGVCDCSYGSSVWSSGNGNGAVAYLYSGKKTIESRSCGNSNALLCCRD